MQIGTRAYQKHQLSPAEGAGTESLLGWWQSVLGVSALWSHSDLLESILLRFGESHSSQSDCLFQWSLGSCSLYHLKVRRCTQWLWKCRFSYLLHPVARVQVWIASFSSSSPSTPSLQTHSTRWGGTLGLMYCSGCIGAPVKLGWNHCQEYIAGDPTQVLGSDSKLLQSIHSKQGSL